MNTCTCVQGFVTKFGKKEAKAGKVYCDVEITTSGAFLDGKMIGRPHTHRIRFGSDKFTEMESLMLGNHVRMDCYSNPVMVTINGERMLFEYLRFKRFREVIQEETV